MYFQLGSTKINGISTDAGSTLPAGVRAYSWLTGYNISRQQTPRGWPDLQNVTMNVSGEFIYVGGGDSAAAQSALNNAVAWLTNLLGTQGVDAGFYQSNGTATAHNILNQNTVGGTRINNVQFPGGATEFASGRLFSFQVTAMVNEPDRTQLIEWNEQFSYTGGGPIYSWSQPIAGVPTRFTTAASSLYVLTQSGSSVFADSHGATPNIIYPDLFNQNRSSYSEERPQSVNGADRNYRTSWTYVYEATSAFNRLSPDGII